MSEGRTGHPPIYFSAHSRVSSLSNALTGLRLHALSGRPACNASSQLPIADRLDRYVQLPGSLGRTDRLSQQDRLAFKIVCVTTTGNGLHGNLQGRRKYRFLASVFKGQIQPMRDAYCECEPSTGLSRRTLSMLACVVVVFQQICGSPRPPQAGMSPMGKVASPAMEFEQFPEQWQAEHNY